MPAPLALSRTRAPGSTRAAHRSPHCHDLALRITNLNARPRHAASARRRATDRARRARRSASSAPTAAASRASSPLIRGELHPRRGRRRAARRAGSSRTSRRKRRAVDRPALDYVLDGDARAARDRARAGRRREARPRRRRGDALAELHQRFDGDRRLPARARAPATLLPGLGFADRPAERAGRELLRRLAHAPQSRAGADVPLRPAAARRADQPPRPRRGAVARGLAARAIRARCC